MTTDFLKSTSIPAVSSKQAFFKELLNVQQCNERVLYKLIIEHST